MRWTKPEVVEIKMDAEIGSYQMDDGDIREPLASPAPTDRADDAA
jgi:hypothetical protein